MRVRAGMIMVPGLLLMMTVLAWGGPEGGHWVRQPFPFLGMGRERWADLLFLRDYNTRLVMFSTALLGIASGIVGTFLLLRRRSLMGDALSHATLPGIALAFIIVTALGGAGKSLPALLLGAAITGGFGCVMVLMVRSFTRLKDDAAMGIVLSVFFGAGVALLGVVQNLPGSSSAGLGSFLYGKTASMVRADFNLICVVAGVSTLAALLLFKEFRLLCFDEGYARSQGWPVKTLDVLMLVLVTAVTVVGLQAVGVVLIIAFLIIPAASARMWTQRLGVMLALAALIGAVSGWVGASISASLVGLPAGAIIVLTAAGIFVVSLMAGPDRGVVARWLRSRSLKRRVERQHLLRAVYELLEKREETGQVHAESDLAVSWRELQSKRSWTLQKLNRIARHAYREGLIERLERDEVRLTEAGLRGAARVTRNHRLWEIYLMEYADVAPSHVDRDADTVEHVLGSALVRQLEAALPQAVEIGDQRVPQSPHPIR